MVYYHHLRKMWVLDPIDLFLLSLILSSFVGSKLRDFLSEKAANERLKADILRQSRLLSPAIEVEKPGITSTLERAKLQKVYKLALKSRGGTQNGMDLLDPNSITEYMADFFRRTTIKVVAFLRTNEAQFRDKKKFQHLVLKIILSQSRFAIEMILRYCNINLTYIWLTGWDEYMVIASLASGSFLGFTAGWLKFGFLTFVTPMFLSGLILRSFYQQAQHNVEYGKLKELAKKLLNDPEIKETVRGIFANGDKISSPTGLRYEDLNWNKNPEIRKTAERLGIFDEELTVNETIETLDPDADVFFPRPKSRTKSTFRPRRRGKTVYYRDFVENLQPEEPINGLEVIDAEILEKNIESPLGNKINLND